MPHIIPARVADGNATTTENEENAFNRAFYERLRTSLARRCAVPRGRPTAGASNWLSACRDTAKIVRVGVDVQPHSDVDSAAGATDISYRTALRDAVGMGPVGCVAY